MTFKIFIGLLALIGIFSTLSPVTVEAVDFTSISNSVITTSNTGGQSGTSGSDGEDGKPGKNGLPGRDGTSAVNVTNEASVWIESKVNGETVIDIHENLPMVNDENIKTVVATTGSANVALHATDTDGAAATLASENINPVIRAYYSIRLMLIKYVSTLF